MRNKNKKNSCFRENKVNSLARTCRSNECPTEIIGHKLEVSQFDLIGWYFLFSFKCLIAGIKRGAGFNYSGFFCAGRSYEERKETRDPGLFARVVIVRNHGI